MSKFRYMFYYDPFKGDPCHEFVDNTSMRYLGNNVVEFEYDPVELYKLVSQYAIQTKEYLYFEFAGSTREFWDGKLQEYFDRHGLNLHLRDKFAAELPDSEQE